MNHPRRFVLLGLSRLLLLLFFAGCSTLRYYRQAAQGQSEILDRARPVSRVLSDATVPETVKRKLQVSQEVRRFAREKWALPVEGRYDRYTDLHRRYVTWVVFASPEFSVEGKSWWYPVVGKLEYRGYFSEAEAKAEARTLKAHGYDVYSGGVQAYSTLGWFHDPILNTFFATTDAEFAELLFHELTHVKVFIPGDTDFNEAFASANAELATEHWLEARGDIRMAAEYRASLAKDRQVIRLLLQTRGLLKRVYANTGTPPAELRREKATAFARMRQEYAELSRRWTGKSRYDEAFAKPWNNARLNTVATYYDLLPGFRRLFVENGNDPRRFYAAVAAMRSLSKEDRRARLEALGAKELAR